MKVYVFGNPDDALDKVPLDIANKLKKDFPGIEFNIVSVNQDFPETNDKVVILDAVDGIDDVTVFESEDIDKLVLSPRGTVHDYDLNFQLKYLKKLGKLKEIIIVGMPLTKLVPYNRVHSIFKKLVAQDMQGS